MFLYGQDEQLKEGEQVTFNQDKIDLITHEIRVKYLKRAQAVDDKILEKLRKKEKEKAFWRGEVLPPRQDDEGAPPRQGGGGGGLE